MRAVFELTNTSPRSACGVFLTYCRTSPSKKGMQAHSYSIIYPKNIHSAPDTSTHTPQDLPAQDLPAASLQTQTHDTLSPIERLPEEILLIILRRLTVADRIKVARCSRSLRAVASISLNRHPGVLDARCTQLTPLRRPPCLLYCRW